MSVRVNIATTTVRRYFDGSFAAQAMIYGKNRTPYLYACIADQDGNVSDCALKFTGYEWLQVHLKPIYRQAVTAKFKSLISAEGNTFKFVRETDPIVIQKRESSIRSHFEAMADKPARVRKGRDKAYLIKLAQGERASQPVTIFMNPTDDQLDKIFKGEIAGYK
ncbi:hypothetical protein ACTXJO_04420 [Psychrobacter celer]|uniref:hypothetical protein n=1 Tax=Psychrobacter celer TaxID=306572 RepID=UPI003FD437B0